MQQTATPKPTLTKQGLHTHLANLRNNISMRRSQLSVAVEYYDTLLKLLSLDTEPLVSPEMLALAKSANSRFEKLAFKK